MSMVEVDLGAISRELNELAARSNNLRGVAAVVAEMLVNEIEENFDTEGHGRWPGPKASTVDRAKRKGYRKGKGFGKLLQDTGRMATGVQPFSDATTAGAATNASYAGFHVEGTDSMPARDFLDVIDDEFLDGVADLLLREVTK